MLPRAVDRTDDVMFFNKMGLIIPGHEVNRIEKYGANPTANGSSLLSSVDKQIMCTGEMTSQNLWL